MKSPWRAKLGPFLKKWEIPQAGQTRPHGKSDREIPLAGQTRANGKSRKEIPLEKKVGFVLEINH
jgi:hypothetical protein